MSAAAVEKRVMQVEVEVLLWCERLMVRHETKASVKG